MNSYEFYKLADLCLERGVVFSQIGPWKVLNICNWVPSRTTQEVRSMPIKFQRESSPAARGK
jgi:hypothetical protein